MQEKTDAFQRLYLLRFQWFTCTLKGKCGRLDSALDSARILRKGERVRRSPKPPSRSFLWWSSISNFHVSILIRTGGM